MHLEVYTGPMGSGKSARLITQIGLMRQMYPNGRMVVLCVDGKIIESRNGTSEKAKMITGAEGDTIRDKGYWEERLGEISADPVNTPTIFFIDEIQFLGVNTAKGFIDALRGTQARIIASGLDLDKDARAYLSTGIFLCNADIVYKHHSQKCDGGFPMFYSMDICPENPDATDKSKYAGVCKACFVKGEKICKKIENGDK